MTKFPEVMRTSELKYTPTSLAHAWRAHVALALLLSVCLLLAACDSSRPPYIETAEIMGTTFSITIDGHDDPSTAVEAAFDEIRRVDHLLSTYKEDSEISEVNRRETAAPIPVSDCFWDVVVASRHYHRLSEGGFDPTIYPLMQLWGFTKKQGRIPAKEELDAVLPLVDLEQITLAESARTIHFERHGMALDFGGIAKGYAVDCAIGKLKDLGINNAIIDAGGNFYALGIPTGRERWRAGVRHPLRRDDLIARLSITNKGVATSGNYERFFEIDGKKYCHIIDPRTGRPVENMLSTTIVADTAMAVDALSTSVFVLGEKKGMDLIESLPGVEGMLILQDAESPRGFRIILSSGLTGKIELLLATSP
jgi:thiamine biosynthesis lipoprotein ApbE